MKRTAFFLLLAAVAAVALVSSLHAQTPQPAGVQARFSTRLLTAATSLELRFPTDMVPDNKMGEAEESPVVVKPAWKGRFVWRSQSSGTFEPLEAPAMGQTHQFSLKEGLADLAGAPVAAGAGWKAEVAGLAVTDRFPNSFSAKNAPREPRLILLFNSPVTAAAAGRSLSYVAKGAQMPAVVSQAALKDLPPSYELNQGFTQRLLTPLGPEADRAKLPPDTVLPHVLVVKPQQPLPVAENWRLVLAAGLSSADGKVKTAEEDAIGIGTVPPLAVKNIYASNELNEPKRLVVYFNKDLAQDVTGEQAGKLVSVSPAPAGMKIALPKDDRRIEIDGEFSVQTPYTVTVAPGLKALDGTEMTEAGQDSVTFEPVAPAVALPAFSASQLSTGLRAFAVQTANMKNLTVRVKQVDRDSLIYALRAWRTYENGPEVKEEKKQGEDDSNYYRIPFDTMPGRKVYEKTHESAVALDRSEDIELKWADVVGEAKAAALFITAEGEPKDEIAKRKKHGAQAFVQLTDLGLAWKTTAKEAMVFVFSHATGQPLAGVELTMLDHDNRKKASAKTAADGTAVLPRTGAEWLMAELAGDLHAVEFASPQTLGMWQFQVPYDYDRTDEAKRRVITFTDRPVYRPGDSVFFKVLARQVTTAGFSLPPALAKATLKVHDAQGRLLTERQVTVSETGGIDGAVALPAGGSLGEYQLTFIFPPSKPAKEGEDEESEDGRSFMHTVLVQDYKPNTFSIAMNEPDLKLDGEKASLPLSAKYMLGKSLSKAKLAWTAEVHRDSFSSEAFPDFTFLDHRGSYYYDEDGWHEVPEEEVTQSLVTGQEKTALSDKGAAVLEFAVPEAPFAGSPRELRVTAEVTDVNQQTITERFTHVLPSSDFYLGLGDVDMAVGAGDTVPVEFCAAGNDGQPWREAVEAKLTIEKVSWTQVRVQTAGGGSNVRNEAKKEIVAEAPVKILPKGQNTEPYLFKAAKPGYYQVTVRSKDGKGRSVQSSTSLQVYGTDWASWKEENGVKIKLTADKEKYHAGEVAHVLVKSPVLGRALVTVERLKVQRHFFTEIQSNAQAVDVPVEAGDAPNVFVSVMVIRGAADDTRQFKQPEYKVGFCQLNVEDTATQLGVAVTTAKPEYQPGEEIEATATITTQGKPAAGAEVTFWAVDEGVLSLVQYETPTPWDEFHTTEMLGVDTGLSLISLLPENPKELEFTNKGYMIGGGGNEDAMQEKMRKNFKPTAFWEADLKADAAGVVRVKFKAPDNLTKFRVMAVAVSGADKFGSGEGSFLTNKPLMLEPALPRFANVGDEVMLKGILMNTTKEAMKVDVALTLDATAKAAGPVTQSVDLPAGATKAVLFPVVFTEPGPAKWRWAATAGTLTDAVQSTLEIGLAEPWLREIKFASVSGPSGENRLARVNPELLAGKGQVEVTLSNCSLGEAAEAVSWLLHYPYGCAEQTSSAALPWIALNGNRDALPNVSKSPEDAKKALRTAVNRLLSMQTASGGLAYWPGGAKAELWISCYGGMVLALCQQNGAVVPKPRLDELANYLSEQLRNSAALSKPGELTYRCFAAYTLSLLGRAEPGYHEVLAKKLALLPAPARAFLALAITGSGGDRGRAEKLLTAPVDPKLEGWRGNLFDSPMTSVSLMAWTKVAPRSPQVAALTGRLLQERSPRGTWRTTYDSAWAVTALAAETQANAKGLKPTDVTLAWAGQEQKVSFPGSPATRSIVVALQPKTALTLASPAGTSFRACLSAKARPPRVPMDARSQGLTISRTYKKLAPDGTTSAVEGLEVGDLVVIDLAVDVPGACDYLAIDDALPATLEALNPEFKSMATATAAPGQPAAMRALPISFSELRADRGLFFCDELWQGGRYGVQYLARVTAEGSVTAPPAKAELMYDPDKFGLSAAQVLKSAPSAPPVAGK